MNEGWGDFGDLPIECLLQSLLEFARVHFFIIPVKLRLSCYYVHMVIYH